MTQNTNRAITLAGANKIFSVIGVSFEALPTGGYRSTGPIELSAKTLTELCQQIILEL
jgi:hypothetical protein